MALTYARYLKLDELLSLQEPLSDGPEHDETLFIVVHQVYELWFKQIIHELGGLERSLEAGRSMKSLHGFGRILKILKTIVAQVDVLETISPLSFLSFRERLESASGFQSLQFRELEFMLGHRGRARFAGIPAEHHPRLEALMKRPSLYDSFLRFLVALGHEVPREALSRDLEEPHAPSPELQRVLIQVYRAQETPAELAERMLDVDEGIQEWRYRHVKMVERTIGTRQGTGGSSGAEYLRSTLFKPLWPDLWAIRSQI